MKKKYKNKYLFLIVLFLLASFLRILYAFYLKGNIYSRKHSGIIFQRKYIQGESRVSVSLLGNGLGES